MRGWLSVVEEVPVAATAVVAVSQAGWMRDGSSREAGCTLGKGAGMEVQIR